MFDLQIVENNLAISELDSDIRSQFGGRISGESYNGTVLRVHFFDPYTQADETATQAIVDAHDPVFISATRAGDDVTVTMTKPRNLDSATELTPSFDDVAAGSPTALVNNVATFTVESADEIALGIVEDYPHQELTI